MINILFWPGKSISSTFIFRKSLLTSQICWQHFLRENLTMTVEFFLLILWQASICSVGILYPSFSKMAANFSSKASAPTSLGMPTMSRHSHLEYCDRLIKPALTFYTDKTAWQEGINMICHGYFSLYCNLEKDSFNLRISTSTLLLTSSSLFWSDKIIGIRSFLLLFFNN